MEFFDTILPAYALLVESEHWSWTVMHRMSGDPKLRRHMISFGRYPRVDLVRERAPRSHGPPLFGADTVALTLLRRRVACRNPLKAVADRVPLKANLVLPIARSKRSTTSNLSSFHFVGTGGELPSRGISARMSFTRALCSQQTRTTPESFWI